MNARQSLLRRVANRIGLERDLQNWKRSLVSLRVARKPTGTGSVLFCDLMTMMATAKVESLIAGLLRFKGYRAIVLLEKPNRAIERIFLGATPDVEFTYLSTAIGAEASATAEAQAETILRHLPSLRRLVELEIDGFRLGRNVLSAILRQLRVGRLEDDNPVHRNLVFKTLARSLAVKVFIEDMFMVYRPNIAIFNERGYTPAGEIFDGCLLRGVDTIQWCGAPQSDCLIYRRYSLDTRGEHPLALSEATWRRLLDIPWGDENDREVAHCIAGNYASGAWYNRQQLQEGKAVLTREAVRRALRLDPQKKTAVIFNHILYDATFFYGESLFEDYEQWLVETVRAAAANTQMNWIVKVHPVNVWRSRMDGAGLVQLEAQALQRQFGELPCHIKLMPADTPVNTFSLFGVADYGLTVRGTIGMELPCFGIPTVTGGTGRYSGRGFTIDPPTRHDYAGLLAKLQEIPRLDADTVRRARLHYYGALSLRPVPMRSFIFDYHAGRNRAGSAYDVVMNREADERLLDTEDLGRLIRWITEMRSDELLTHDV